MKHKNTLCRKNAEFSYIKPGDTHKTTGFLTLSNDINKFHDAEAVMKNVYLYTW
jgi:hypothetical protein